MNIKLLLAFVSGAAAGATAMYYICKQKMQKLADNNAEDLKEMEQYYVNKYEPEKAVEVKKPEKKEDKPATKDTGKGNDEVYRKVERHTQYSNVPSEEAEKEPEVKIETASEYKARTGKRMKSDRYVMPITVSDYEELCDEYTFYDLDYYPESEQVVDCSNYFEQDSDWVKEHLQNGHRFIPTDDNGMFYMANDGLEECYAIHRKPGRFNGFDE